jgi:hypothetical protein
MSPLVVPAAGLTARIHTLATVPGEACGELGWTGPVTIETARRIACDPAVTRLLLGPDGQPLEAGRTRRLVTRHQRVALDQRDGGCIYPGCDRSPVWCDAHHVRHWVDGGTTDLDNLCLLCRFHHRLVHDREIPILRTARGGFIVLPPHVGRVPYNRRR